MENYLEKITDEANKRNIPITVMCENVGLARNTIANWKRGSEPSLDKMLKIIRYLGLSADELFDLKEHVLYSKEQMQIDKRKQDLKHTLKTVQYIKSEDDIHEMYLLADGLEMYVNKELDKINKGV